MPPALLVTAGEQAEGHGRPNDDDNYRTFSQDFQGPRR